MRACHKTSTSRSNKGVCAPVAATPSRPADVPLAPAFAPITLPTPTFASMAPPAPVQRSRRRSRSRQRSPRADAHVPRSRRRPIASLSAVMAAAAAGGGMPGYLQGRVMRSSKRQSRIMTSGMRQRYGHDDEYGQRYAPGRLNLNQPRCVPQHAAIFVVVAIAARSKIGCERTGTRATSGSSSSLHITESRSRHSRSRRRPRERSRRCGGGGGERRRTIASLAAASGGMHGYLQGRDAIEQASVSKRQSRLRLRLRRPGAYRWPGTPHGLKAEPQGAGSANVYSLRRS